MHLTRDDFPLWLARAAMAVLMVGAGAIAGPPPWPSEPLASRQHLKTGAGRTPPAPPPSTASPGPVMGHLETRDRVVTISLGETGPLYSIRTKKGRMLHEHLSANELQARSPGLFDLVKTGHARATHRKGVTADARLAIPTGSAERR